MKWKDDQGYGFIAPNSGGEHVFVHIESFSNRQRRPFGNEFVTYEVSSDEKGRKRAEHVAFLGDSPAIPDRSGATKLALPGLFLTLIALSAYVGKLPFVVLGFYLVASLIAFLAYAWDKSAAQADQWRTNESTLHLLALIGGWPGALAAQTLLRHKSKKRSFRVVFWATVALNCAGLLWLFTPSGSAALRDFLRGLTYQ